MLQYKIANFVHALAVLDGRKECRTRCRITIIISIVAWPPLPPHAIRVALHDAQVGADGVGKIDLVDDQQIGLRDAGSS